METLINSTNIRGALLLCAVTLICLSGCTSPTLVPPQQTQAAATQLAALNAELTRTAAATTPRAHTPAPTPPPFGSGAPVPSYAGTPQPIPITGATATQMAICNQPMAILTPGPKAIVLVKNKTSVPITFTMGLSGRNYLGDCGYIRKAGIPAGKSTTISVPWSNPPAIGPCYWAYAWIPGPKHQITTVSDGGFCLVNRTNWIINVTNQAVRLVAP